jgi:hypothetical protein
MSNVKEERQKVLDQLHSYFVVAGFPLGYKDGGYGCAYQGDDGCCFIGYYIPESEYQLDFEMEAVGELIDNYEIDSIQALAAKVDPDGFREGYDFLEAIQAAHDQAVTACMDRRVIVEGPIARRAAQWKLWIVARDFDLEARNFDVPDAS